MTDIIKIIYYEFEGELLWQKIINDIKDVKQYIKHLENYYGYKNISYHEIKENDISYNRIISKTLN
jgi:hypothetical protein